MDTKQKRRFFRGHGKWALPVAALAAYLANPVLGMAALVVLAALWHAESRAMAAYGVSQRSDGASAPGAPSKREVMRCWMMMF